MANTSNNNYNNSTIKKLVDFGNFVLSDKRKKSFIHDPKLPSIKERQKNVGHHDLANFFDMKGLNVKGYTGK